MNKLSNRLDTKRAGVAFNPENREHRAIVISAMAAADSLGVGRARAALDQLELNDITIPDRDNFMRHLFAWGRGI